MKRCEECRVKHKNGNYKLDFDPKFCISFWIEIELSNGKKVLLSSCKLREEWEDLIKDAEYELTDREEYLIKKGRIGLCGGY